MRRLGHTVARLAEAGRRQERPSSGGRLLPFDVSGPNPGALDAFAFMPDEPAGAGLVVVLHGCTQTADGYDQGAGWSRHAESEGFAVLYPQQRRANNPGLCFNWFSPEDTARNRGEAASIAAMIVAMVRDHGLDPSRVFITGLSAGGAMSATLLALYPELFAGGAVIAGLPHGAAASMRQALEAMRGLGPAPNAGGIRKATPDVTRWPRISIIHGSGDQTVNVANADRLLSQWLDFHGLRAGPDRDVATGRRRHRQWTDEAGEVRVEDLRIEAMGHGTPLDLANDPLGVAGPFMLDVGFSSTAWLIEAWGLSHDPDRPRAPAEPAQTLDAKPAPRAPGSPMAGSTAGIQAVIETALRKAGLLP